jgi:GAF domain-containing protein
MSREVFQIEDAWTDPLYEQEAAVKISGGRSMIGVPLMREGEPIGVIDLARTRVEPFAQREIALVATFADQAVIAIENVRLFETEQQRTRELSESLEQQTATSKVLDVISRSVFDLNAVFEAVAESSVKLCGADRAFIYRFDGEMLRMAVAYNTPPEFKEYVEKNPNPPRPAYVCRSNRERQTTHIPDIFTDPEYIRFKGFRQNPHSPGSADTQR